MSAQPGLSLGELAVRFGCVLKGDPDLRVSRRNVVDDAELDTLAEAWAANHDGADLWADSTARFLDPCTKSGVFLREITRRLTEGLADEIPTLEERVDHILTERAPQIVDRLAEGVPRIRFRLLRPEQLEQPIASDEALGFHGKVHQQRQPARLLKDGARPRPVRFEPTARTRA